MAKQTINVGTAANDRTGDPLRTAFGKINSNFTELYNKDASDFNPSAINQSLIPANNVAYDLGSSAYRFRDLYLSGTTIDLGGTTLSVANGELQIGNTGINEIVSSQISEFNPFNQDLNTTDNPQFNRVGLTLGEINITQENNFSVFTSPDGSISKEFRFDSDGNFTLPNSTSVFHDGLMIGSEGTYAYIDIPNNANAHTYGGLRLGNDDGPITFSAGLQGNTTYQWVLDTDGSLTTSGYINFEGGTYIGDEPGAGTPVFRIVAPSGYGATIETDSGVSSNNHTWAFNIDGSLTFPGGSTIETEYGGGAVLVIDGKGNYVDIRDSGTILVGYNSTGSVQIGNPEGGTMTEIVSEKLKFLLQTVPTTSVGASGDAPGLVAFDSTYMYYCAGLYNGTDNIWRRVAWSIDTW